MNKFATNLSQSGNDVLEKRAEQLGEAAKLEQESLVNNLKRDVSRLKIEISNLADLSPKSQDSLMPGGDNFDAKKWVEKLHECKVKLELAEVQLKIANSTLEEWFTETVANAKG